MITIAEARSEAAIASVKSLFQAYADSLDFDLSFQNFGDELETLPGGYARPGGRLFLATADDAPAGCVGLRPFEDRICELKRLFVRPEFRGQRLGRALTERAIAAAKTIGYDIIRLDTITTMDRANRLYAALGFRQIKPYRPNPITGATFFELILTD